MCASCDCQDLTILEDLSRDWTEYLWTRGWIQELRWDTCKPSNKTTRVPGKLWTGPRIIGESSRAALDLSG
jgi:hypothetical protein